MKIKISEQKGFTLLLSLLVISIILSVGFGVFDIMTKELKLSGIGRESQISFYAADAGIECAYFWDIKHPNKPESYFDLDLDNNFVEDIECGGTGVVSETYFKDEDGDGYEETSYFNFNMGEAENGNQKCAKVSVKKDVEIKDSKKITTTIIQSKGYNYFCGSKSSHKVERAIRVISTKTEEV